MAEDLQNQLHQSLQAHFQLPEEAIDNWLTLYKSQMYESVTRANDTIWRCMEQEALENFE